MRIRFEDFTLSRSARDSIIQTIVGWAVVAGRQRDEPVYTPAALPTIMATSPPHPGRWRASREHILAALRSVDVHDIAYRLGYDIEDTTLWS